MKKINLKRLFAIVATTATIVASSGCAATLERHGIAGSPGDYVDSPAGGALFGPNSVSVESLRNMETVTITDANGRIVRRVVTQGMHQAAFSGPNAGDKAVNAISSLGHTAAHLTEAGAAVEAAGSLGTAINNYVDSSSQSSSFSSSFVDPKRAPYAPRPAYGGYKY
jgi:hypothetical protein